MKVSKTKKDKETGRLVPDIDLEFIHSLLKTGEWIQYFYNENYTECVMVFHVSKETGEKLRKELKFKFLKEKPKEFYK